MAKAELSPEALVALSLSAQEPVTVTEQSQMSSKELRSSGPQGQVEPLTLIHDPSAWYAADMREHPEQWSYTLTAQDIAELEAAVAAVEERPDLAVETTSPRSPLSSRNNTYLNLPEVVRSSADFPLPTLGPRLLSFRREVLSGKGFQLIRGVPVQRWTRQQSVIAYWGMGVHWGRPLSQNRRGHLVGHVKDIGLDVRNPETRIYGTALAQPFHTDISDIVGLLALKNAAEGGLSSWSSSITVHNELLKRGRRDLVEELAGHDWWLDRKGEIPEGGKPYYRLPIFHYHKGFLSCSFSDTYYQLAQRHPEVPRLTERQQEALRAYAALARSNALRMDFELQPGDIQLLNNTEMLHSRSAFRDHADPDEKRHLLRLWLSPEDSRPLPDCYANLWGSTTPGKRGGLVVPGHKSTIALEAE